MRLFAHRIAVVLVALALPACVIIEDGEVGVEKSFGSISDDPVGQGIAIQVPVARTVETWNVKLQEIKERAQVPSSEGLIVALEASLLFRVEPSLRPGDPQDHRARVGLRREAGRALLSATACATW